MLTIYSDDHRLHHGRCELIDGKLMPCFEMPSRADHVPEQVKKRNLGPVEGPRDFGRAPCCGCMAPTTGLLRRGLGALVTAGPKETCCPSPGQPAPCVRSNRLACMVSLATTASMPARRSPPVPGKPPTVQPRLPSLPRPRSSKAPIRHSPCAVHQGTMPRPK